MHAESREFEFYTLLLFFGHIFLHFDESKTPKVQVTVKNAISTAFYGILQRFHVRIPTEFFIFCMVIELNKAFKLDYVAPSCKFLFAGGERSKDQKGSEL